jgi:hypothetical protein
MGENREKSGKIRENPENPVKLRLTVSSMFSATEFFPDGQLDNRDDSDAATL